MKIVDILKELRIDRLVATATWYHVPLYEGESPYEDESEFLALYNWDSEKDGYSSKHDHDIYLNVYFKPDRSLYPPLSDEEYGELMLCNERAGFLKKFEGKQNRNRICREIRDQLLTEEGALRTYMELEDIPLDALRNAAHLAKQAKKSGESCVFPVEFTHETLEDILPLEKLGVAHLVKRMYYETEDCSTQVKGVEIAEDFAKVFRRIDTQENRTLHRLLHVLIGLCDYVDAFYVIVPEHVFFEMYRRLQDKDDRLPVFTPDELAAEMERLKDRGYLETRIIRIRNDDAWYYADTNSIADFYDPVSQTYVFNDSLEGNVPIVSVLFYIWGLFPETVFPFYMPSYEELETFCRYGYPRYIGEYDSIYDFYRDVYLDDLSFTMMRSNMFRMFSRNYDGAGNEDMYSYDDAMRYATERFTDTFESLIYYGSTETVFFENKEILYGIRDDSREKYHMDVHQCRLKTGNALFKGHSAETIMRDYPEVWEALEQFSGQMFDYDENSWETHMAEEREKNEKADKEYERQHRKERQTDSGE